MEYMQGVTGIYVREETAVTLGKFDGIHKGHRKLIRRILQAEKMACPVWYLRWTMEKEESWYRRSAGRCWKAWECRI